jgi:hypothetical protein
MILVSFLVGRLLYASGHDVSGESVLLLLRVYLYLCWVVAVDGWGYYGTGGSCPCSHLTHAIKTNVTVLHFYELYATFWALIVTVLNFYKFYASRWALIISVIAS